MFRERIVDRLKLSAVTALLALMLGITAFGEAPDENEKGSISVVIKSEDTKEGIPGGSMTLYRAGKFVRDQDGNYSFELTGEFTGSGCSLDDLSAALAKSLAGYAENEGIEGKTKDIENDGRVVFEDLETGLYLLVQKEAASGYYAVNPFLVSLPLYDEETGTYKYSVDATPKTEEVRRVPETETEPGPKETQPSETSPNSGGSNHSGGGGGSGGGSGSGGPGDGGSSGEGDTWNLLPLPQTGQGRAMLTGTCILVLSGMALIVLLRRRRRGKEEN